MEMVVHLASLGVLKEDMEDVPRKCWRNIGRFVLPAQERLCADLV